jgi:hypothetical protein
MRFDSALCSSEIRPGINHAADFITILILILMLGILVSAHEAGHLVMAKCFSTSIV